MPKSDITLVLFSSIKIDNRKVRNITEESMRHLEHFYIKKMNKMPRFAFQGTFSLDTNQLKLGAFSEKDYKSKKIAKGTPDKKTLISLTH